MDTSLASSRFSRRFQLSTPIALAPMAYAAGGALSAAVARAGGLALVGGGYGELDWLQREYPIAVGQGPRERIGVGFITWRLDQDASSLDWVLQHRPRAVMLSFGDPRPYAQRIRASGAALVCQLQRIDHLPQALEAGAEVIVAQGAEAGGHSVSPLEGRGLMSLVPEMADWLAAHSPDTTLLAAGGVADGRALAALRLLGADGVMVGTRLWATQESLASTASKQRALELDGDATTRSVVFDALAARKWPDAFEFTRASGNPLVQEWEGRHAALRAAPEVLADYQEGVRRNDFQRAFVTVGEAIGLVRDLPRAEDLIARISDEARRLLGESR
jgi:nitronate monooxygenase